MAENTLYFGWARDVLDTEAEGLRKIAAALDHDFVRTAETLLHCKGRMVIAGTGRPGHIGHKVAVTMASTGTSVLFVHPVEAVHGDLDMIVDHDVVVVTSNSSESDETAATIPALRRKNITPICITVHPTSTMMCHADIHITVAVSKETCPFGPAPTSSTTAVMALDDVLAVILLRIRTFTPDDLTLSHPAGSLGKRLLLRMADIMYRDGALPAVLSGTPLKEAIVRMNERGSGTLAVTDVKGCLKGVLTDGDLRRLFQECDSFAGLKVDDIVHASPKTTSTDRLATEVLKAMQSGHVNSPLVVEENGVLIGALNMHGLSMARIV